jgi:hypothetical protein
MVRHLPSAPARSVVLAAAALALVLATPSGCASGPDPRPDKSLRPDGERWFCAQEASGMLSVCERQKKKCRRARKYLAALAHRRGDQMELGKCRAQPRAYCLTAERRIPKAPPEANDDEDAAEENDEDEAEDREAQDDLEESADSEGESEGESETEEDRFVLEDQIWLCYATADNCAEQRKNMYYFGFTHVSRCGRWK